MRLDKELVNRNLARSRTLAQKLIHDSFVSVNGVIVTKSSYDVLLQDTLTVHDSEHTQYVSRAGHKLMGALKIFSDVRVTGKYCLDAGASTGGFTDVLLQQGAAHVAAVDVGHDQLVPELREDPRVSVYEGMNVRYLRLKDIGGAVDLTVSDLSFISLTLVMDALAQATKMGGDLLLMIKPQFEVGQHKIGRGGVVSDPTAHQEAIEKVSLSAKSCGLNIAGLEKSPLPGQDGNQEFFLWCTK
ncbi:TlyA family RNA methyltransferase [Rothia sp. P13129]|uniref:TlyA family RNA methyltransferase n=1 Tax=Rothia sp. P13129 TaxID=3402664 RepID=UPI003ACB1CFF